MAIDEKAREIAELWRRRYHLSDGFDPESDFDRLFTDGERFELGELEVRVTLSPGHTLGSITYVANDAAFLHDTLMYPHNGSSRADFPGGSTSGPWDSIQAILALPAGTRLFVGHDYGGGGRDEPAWEATVAEHLERNVCRCGEASAARTTPAERRRLRQCQLARSRRAGSGRASGRSTLPVRTFVQPCRLRSAERSARRTEGSRIGRFCRTQRARLTLQRLDTRCSRLLTGIQATMNTHRYTVPGMHCGGCRKTITTAIEAADAEAVVAANTDDKSVTVQTTSDYARMRVAIESAGYDVGEPAP